MTFEGAYFGRVMEARDGPCVARVPIVRKQNINGGHRTEPGVGWLGILAPGQ